MQLRIQIRIRDRIRTQGLDKKCNSFSLGLHKGRLSYRRSLQPSKLEISSVFSISVGHLCPPGSGSSRPISMLIHSDPEKNTDRKNPETQVIKVLVMYFGVPRSLGQIQIWLGGQLRIKKITRKEYLPSFS
jgi:hypothetical protein